MSASAFAIGPGDRPRALNVVGEQITVLASNEATGGYELFLQEGPAGSGPPPHRHDWDESFFVLDGEIEFGFGDEQMTATAGTLVHLPAGTTHWFRFGAAGGRMLSITGEGSDAANFFTDVAQTVPDGSVDLEKLGRVAARHSLELG